MKGIIFNAVEAAVIRGFGEDAWDDTLDAANAGGAYTSLGNYDDDELVAIIEALPAEVGATLPDRLRWVGASAAPILAEAFPQFFEGVDLRGFLPMLNHMIHPEVRKLYPGATPPDFDIVDDGGSEISLLYFSERKMCALAEGFTIGVAAQLGEEVTVSQASCMHDGAETCDIRILFPV